jgi:hypothetical protein
VEDFSNPLENEIPRVINENYTTMTHKKVKNINHKIININ